MKICASSRAVSVIWPRFRLTGSRAFVLGVSVCLGGCTWMPFHKSARVFTPPPVQSNTASLKPVPMLDRPDLEITMSLGEPAFPEIEPELPGPPKPAAPPVRRPPVATAPKPVQPPAPETPSAPKIVQIFTPEQQREYIRELDESLQRVRRALDVVSRKNLTTEQSDAAERIRVFERQAEQARDQDLVTAVNLAKRADLLAKDLLDRLP